MKAYICPECGWEHQVRPMHDRVYAVRRHQLGHVLDRRGGTGAVRDVLDALTVDALHSGGVRVLERPLAASRS